MKHFLTLIKNGNFLYLWTSQVLSQLTVNILSFLVLIRLYEQTQSTIASSLIWVSYALPAIVFGPIGAVTTDMFDKRKILMFSNLFQACVVFFFALLYQRYIFLSYGIVFAYSFLNQFYVPAEAATLPTVVSKKSLPHANGLLFITQQSALTVGFVLAGLLYDVVGFGASLVAASLALFVAFISVSFLPERKALEKLPVGIEKSVTKFLSELFEGYNFIKSNNIILLPFVLLVGLQVALSIIVVNMPVLASDIVKVKPSLAGIIIAVPGGLGALLGTWSVSQALSRGVRKKYLVETSLFVVSLGILLLAFLVPNIEFWLGRLIAILIFFAMGTFYVGALIPSLTFLQEETPRNLTGRVFGNIWFITTVATVIPVLFSATITEIFGVVPMLSFLGMSCFAALLISHYYLRRVYVHKYLKGVSV